MAARHFFTAEAKKRVAATIKEIESATSAEVVVAVRASSGNYRNADYLFGFVIALAALSLLLFLPWSFAFETWPLELVICFGAGVYACASIAPLRRLLSGRRRMDGEVARAARAAFVDLGISRTRDRSGILVYVSLFERRVEVVADIGVPREISAGGVAALDQALGSGPTMDRFIAALLSLKGRLADELPRRPDDVNELPDEVDDDAGDEARS